MTIIENSEVVFENANRPQGFGFIDPNNFTPYPKNPTIAKVFKEIDYADELGSGVRNLYKYSKLYGGGDPKLIEEDIFKIIVPLKTTEQVTEQVTEQAIMEFCAKPKNTQEIMEYLGLKHREHFRSHILKSLIKKGLLAPTLPDKPNSPKQKYIAKRKNDED